MYSGTTTATTAAANETTTSTDSQQNYVLIIVFGILSLLAFLWALIIIFNWDTLSKSIFKTKNGAVVVKKTAKKSNLAAVGKGRYYDERYSAGYPSYPPARFQSPFFPPPRNAYSPYSAPYY